MESMRVHRLHFSYSYTSRKLYKETIQNLFVRFQKSLCLIELLPLSDLTLG